MNKEQKQAIKNFCEKYESCFEMFENNTKFTKAEIIEWLREIAECDYGVELE